MRDRYRERLQRRASWFLEPGEKVETAIRGGLLVILTNRNLYLTKIGAFSFLGIKEVVAKHPIGTVEVFLFRSTPNRLTINGEPISFFGQAARAEEIVSATATEPS